MPALLWEGNDVGRDKALTYAQTLAEVCRLANWLRSVGVKKGDAVAIYMPMVCELPIAMLACARIGAMHSVVFGGFSAEALGSRIEDCKARVLLTASGVKRGPKAIDLKVLLGAACCVLLLLLCAHGTRTASKNNTVINWPTRALDPPACFHTPPQKNR